MGGETKSLTYRFKMANGSEKEFTVRLSFPSMRLEPAERKEYPAWTQLKFHQCSNCPLSPKTHPRCPIAANLTELIEFFRDSVSTEMVEITITTETREYRRKAPLADGVSSLMGLYMATSGCPILDKMRPMVYTHLPFATLQESMYRALSMYVLAQFLIQAKGGKPDWELKLLMRLYDDIKEVNKHFCERLRSINPQDASLNALVTLDCLADFSHLTLQRKYLKEMENLFSPYLEG